LNGEATSSSLTLSQQYPVATLLVRLLYLSGTAILIYLIAVDLYKFGQRSTAENLFTIGATMLILLGFFTAAYAQAIVSIPFAEQITTLRVLKAVPKKPTHLYILPLVINWMSQSDLGQSPAIVYENGIPLAGPNALHQSIKDDGNGGYSVWNGSLYFSSSDNSDPRSNGRKYELAWPRPIRPGLQVVTYIGGMLGAIMLIFRKSLMTTASSWIIKFKINPN